MSPQKLGASKLPSLLSTEKETGQGSGGKSPPPPGQVSVDGPGEALSSPSSFPFHPSGAPLVTSSCCRMRPFNRLFPSKTVWCVVYGALHSSLQQVIGEWSYPSWMVQYHKQKYFPKPPDTFSSRAESISTLLCKCPAVSILPTHWPPLLVPKAQSDDRLSLLQPPCYLQVKYLHTGMTCKITSQYLESVLATIQLPRMLTSLNTFLPSIPKAVSASS